MTTKRPSELDLQDRVADAIWFVPQSDDAQAHYVLEYSGRGPKAYLNLWLGKEFGQELTEWNWVVHESAVELWRRDSTDEEIIDVLLPVQELRAEFDRLRRDGQQARAASQRREADLRAKIERRDKVIDTLTKDRTICLEQHCPTSSLMELRAENERLRAKAKDHETSEQLMFEVARRLFGEDEAKRWLTVVLEAYADLGRDTEC